MTDDTDIASLTGRSEDDDIHGPDWIDDPQEFARTAPRSAYMDESRWKVPLPLHAKDGPSKTALIEQYLCDPNLSSDARVLAVYLLLARSGAEGLVNPSARTIASDLGWGGYVRAGRNGKFECERLTAAVRSLKEAGTWDVSGVYTDRRRKAKTRFYRPRIEVCDRPVVPWRWKASAKKLAGENPGQLSRDMAGQNPGQLLTRPVKTPANSESWPGNSPDITQETSKTQEAGTQETTVGAAPGPNQQDHTGEGGLGMLPVVSQIDGNTLPAESPDGPVLQIGPSPLPAYAGPRFTLEDVPAGEFRQMLSCALSDSGVIHRVARNAAAALRVAPPSPDDDRLALALVIAGRRQAEAQAEEARLLAMVA